MDACLAEATKPGFVQCCDVEQAKPDFVQCLGKLDWNRENVCSQSLRITLKPGAVGRRWPPQKLQGDEFVKWLDQFNIATRVAGDPITTPGLAFSGFGHEIEPGRAADGTPIYTLVVTISFNDIRISKDPAFRKCQTNGRPLIVSGHIGVAAPK
jgi:hypothetical protein